ncbi:hypothetical protein BC943DRAFT_360259 [Umbelopsis sp. AD052]|nr:hypothetical protein BC943DRAFT_360259 [Umbelopsis sp. AD052]
MVIVRTTWCLVGLVAASILQFTAPARSNKPKEEENWEPLFYSSDFSEKIAVEHGLAALERLQTRGDCFQVATAALKQGCTAMDALSISKIQYAVALTKCELDTASQSLPPECTSTISEQSLLHCVRSLAQVPQWWTSYSGYLRQEYSKIQTNELHRAQKQVTELQNTLSQLANEYNIAMNQIVDMAMQKMTSVTEKEAEITNYALGELEVYTSFVMDALEKAGSMHNDIYNVLNKLEAHEVRLIDGLEDSIDKINTTMYQMAEKFATQLQKTYLYSNSLPFNWVKSTIYHLQHGFTLSIAKVVSVSLTTITPLAVLLQGLRREFTCLALYMATNFFQYPWVYIGVHPASCKPSGIRKHQSTLYSVLTYLGLRGKVGVTSLAEVLVWLWITQMLTTLSWDGA